MSTAPGCRTTSPPTHSDIPWSEVAPPAEFEPALPPPEAGRTLIIPVSCFLSLRSPWLALHELPWCPAVHCTNLCTNDDHCRSRPRRGIRPPLSTPGARRRSRRSDG